MSLSNVVNKTRRQIGQYSLVILAAIFSSSLLAQTPTNAGKNAVPTGVQKTLIIDVRSQEEYDSGHIAGAINIPYDQIANRIVNVTQDKNGNIGVYCKTGRRSSIAEKTLEKLGFTSVQNLGGIEGLQQRGYDLGQ